MWYTASLDTDEDDDNNESINRPTTSHSNVLQWKLVSDKHIDAIQAVEQSVKKLLPEYMHCLLCLPCAGGALWYYDFREHFIRW